MAQESRRKDGFGTEGIGEDRDQGIGTGGHASQGGTGNTETGGTIGNKKPHGNPANRQTVDNIDKTAANEPRRTGRQHGGG